MVRAFIHRQGADHGAVGDLRAEALRGRDLGAGVAGDVAAEEPKLGREGGGGLGARRRRDEQRDERGGEQGETGGDSGHGGLQREAPRGRGVADR